MLAPAVPHSPACSSRTRACAGLAPPTCLQFQKPKKKKERKLKKKALTGDELEKEAGALTAEELAALEAEAAARGECAAERRGQGAG